MITIFVEMISTRNIFPYLKSAMHSRVISIESEMALSKIYLDRRVGYSAALKMILMWVKEHTTDEFKNKTIDKLIEFLKENRF